MTLGMVPPLLSHEIFSACCKLRGLQVHSLSCMHRPKSRAFGSHGKLRGLQDGKPQDDAVEAAVDNLADEQGGDAAHGGGDAVRELHEDMRDQEHEVDMLDDPVAASPGSPGLDAPGLPLDDLPAEPPLCGPLYLDVPVCQLCEDASFEVIGSPAVWLFAVVM